MEYYATEEAFLGEAQWSEIRIERTTAGTMNSEQISLYFNDKLIAMAFGELLSSLGFQAEAISSLDQLANAKKVITEPIFFESLSEDQKKQCLLVGNQYTSDKLGCPVIRQPLTPVKIQAGLQEFLGASVAH